MDFDQLETFLEVARLSSFSRAAEKRFRTQPAISSQIRLLEEEVGAKLHMAQRLRIGHQAKPFAAGRLRHPSSQARTLGYRLISSLKRLMTLSTIETLRSATVKRLPTR